MPALEAIDRRVLASVTGGFDSKELGRAARNGAVSGVVSGALGGGITGATGAAVSDVGYQTELW